MNPLIHKRQQILQQMEQIQHMERGSLQAETRPSLRHPGQDRDRNALPDPLPRAFVNSRRRRAHLRRKVLREKKHPHTSRRLWRHLACHRGICCSLAAVQIRLDGHLSSLKPAITSRIANNVPLTRPNRLKPLLSNHLSAMVLRTLPNQAIHAAAKLLAFRDTMSTNSDIGWSRVIISCFGWESMLFVGN